MINNLNERQKEAVEILNGPLLILAGAGTGKTTVLTSRVINILEQKLCNLSEILAVTFTNKAANEMKSRIQNLLNYPIHQYDDIWIGTFHSICLKILRIYHEKVGFNKNFTIADVSDQKQVIKKILKIIEITEKEVPINTIMYKLSSIKDRMLDVNDAEVGAYNTKDIDMTFFYSEYQKYMRLNQMMDFDDLLFNTILLFRNHPDALAQMQNRFKYVMVDEYQDTNKIQHNMISMLVQKSRNICCVGDDDQSIYSWRGADISNILNFKKQYPDAQIVSLEDNYRSTSAILNAAQSVISCNADRYEKNLNSNIGEGDKIEYTILNDDREESWHVARIIKDSRNEHQYSDIAILVRTSMQMRAIEESMIQNHIPYKVIGGIKFYERKEIKDCISYLKLLINDNDVVALERIINTPKRGIGDKGIEKIISHINTLGSGIMKGLESSLENYLIPSKSKSEISQLVYNIKSFRERVQLGENTSEFIEEYLDVIGYMPMMRMESIEDQSINDKIDNVIDLVGNISRFATLEMFFEHIALVSDVDNIDSTNVVNIMTMHAAKGLEFGVVIAPGWEEDLFPNKRVVDESGRVGLEEERRLAYVTITRAKHKLYISSSKSRFFYGRYVQSLPSRFLGEIDKHYLHITDKTQKYRSDDYDDSTYQTNQRSQFSFNGSNVTQKSRYNNTTKPSFTNNNSSFSQLKVGQSVSHEKFGSGVIKKLVGQFAEVKFDDGMMRIIKASFLK